MTLKTQRLEIRPVIESDWKSIQRIWKDFSCSPYSQYDHPYNTADEEVRARIARWEAANRSDDHFFFAVCLDGTLIGYIAFNKRADSYELGYCFHSDYFGHGYAKESHLALFHYLAGLGITKITVGTALNNTPSVKLLKSLGFRKTGEEKVSFYKDSEGKDIIFDGGIFELDQSSSAE